MRRVFLVMAACFLLASPAMAGGAVDLYGTYGEITDGDGGLGLGARLSIGGVHWMVDVAATGYQDVESKIDGSNPNPKEDVKYRAFDLGLRYLFYDGHKLRPYLGFGATYASASAANTAIDGGLGLYGMGGIRLGKTPGLQFMAELMYRYTEVTAKYDLAASEDINIGGLALNVGISFVF